MPLPPNDSTETPWPPPQVKAVYAQHAVDDAWYVGDADKLSAAPQPQASKRPRWFWKQNTSTSGQTPVKLHVPLPAEIARMSATVLFGELFSATFADRATSTRTVGEKPAADPHQELNDRLEDLLDDAFHATLLEGGEYSGAHGGVYYRVTWDTTVVTDRPFLTVHPSDTAVPEFRYGRLTAVTFWSKLPDRAKNEYRLLERHEPGTIEYGLYESTRKGQLGHRVPLDAHPDTAGLVPLVNELAQIETGSTLLTARYLPNVKPNRGLRSDGLGRYMGRSDFDEVYDYFDAADETYTSWMRDIRLAKSRLSVPAGQVKAGSAGQGGSWNADEEISFQVGETIGSYNPNAQQGAAQAPKLELFQPAIRAADHEKTLDATKQGAYEAAGYSPQTFGDAGDVAVTATEVENREKLTMKTLRAKQLAAGPEIVLLLAAMVDVDEHVFAGPGRAGMLPVLEWPAAAADSPKVVAETLQALKDSDSTSIRTRVETLHPEWTDDMVDREVEEIRADLAATVPAFDPYDGYDGTTDPTVKPDEDAPDGDPTV